MFDKTFAQLRLRVFDNFIDTAEVVRRLDNIVNINALVGDADSVGFEDISRLIVGETTSFDMVGVVGQLNLYFMIDPAVAMAFLFIFYPPPQYSTVGILFISQRTSRMIGTPITVKQSPVQETRL